MKIIDAHAHYINEPDYLPKLFQVMEDNLIEKVCLSGIGPLFNCKTNREVKSALKKYPNKIIGSYYVRPGVSDPEEIDLAYNDGFRMLKVTLPRGPYNLVEYDKYWKRAEKFQMPVLFHTGIVTTAHPAPEENISSWNMHPMRLEPIVNKFPKLKIIIAHLGVHWNMDAAELARMRPNVFVDLTGEPGGWRKRLDAEGLKKYFWWDGAYNKIIFGTDVHYNKIHDLILEDRKRYMQDQVSEEILQNIFYQNIGKLLLLTKSQETHELCR